MKRTTNCILLLVAALGLGAAPGLMVGQEVTSVSLPVQPPAPAEHSGGEALEANPNRPSSSNSADVLAPGVLQWEYGFSREWSAAAERQNLLGGELRFGVWRNVELRWGGNDLVHNVSVDGHTQGFGDQYFSGQVRFLKESESAPALALSYAIQVPTGNEALGLGSGRVNHSWTFLASKELHKFTCDFNAGYQLVGKPSASGHDQNAVLILTFQRALYGPLSAIGEIGGETRLSAEEPALATTLWALTYRVHRQVVVDAAIDVGITDGAPHKRILFGITYAIANLYPRR